MEISVIRSSPFLTLLDPSHFPSIVIVITMIAQRGDSFRFDSLIKTLNELTRVDLGKIFALLTAKMKGLILLSGDFSSFAR